MPLLPHEPARYLRNPRLEPGPRGGATLTLVAWDGAAEHLVTAGLDEEGAPFREVKGPTASAIVALSPEQPVPSGDPTDEERAAHDGWSVLVRREGYRSEVVVRLPDGREQPVWSAWGTAAAPALATAPDGAWVAFHHNVREDDGRPDLAKWIAVRFVDGEGRVWEPTAEMTDRDRDLAGEEQSFEFPSLAAGANGAVALFGRGSHCFWRQDLSADGFTPRRALGDGSSWGCRGRRVAVCRLSDGSLLTARRERRGIAVERAEPPAGERPALRPAATRLENDPPETPVERREDPAARDGRRTLFGDIHQHSAHSDGIGTADEPYLRARHVYGDDFCALTDHESFLGKRIGPGEWAYLQAVAERHHEPGRFSTLLAYEWTGKMYPGPGHKVIYLPGPIPRPVSRDEVPDGGAMVAEAQRMGGFAVPHHVGWTGADVEGHDPEGQPVWEICSCHGCYESFAHELGQRGDLREQMVDAVLRRGLRFGFIASSDGHGLLWHHGVGRKRDPFRTGLTAVQAKQNDREAILDAIRERRCYATSGARILLDLRVDGHPMGSELDTGGPAEAVAVAHGSGDIVSLELVGREGVLATAAGRGSRAEITARVTDAYVYARVRQADGEMAWSSPVFLGSSG